ncbi:MAG: pyridoxamine 5'-phosphate oxidase family protein [Chloroflexi bacterium]|nr:pyridoxamine 5'-phosphate oxidase family protein [Chloroflexota bacterium]
MLSALLNKLRERIETFLSAHPVGVLSTSGLHGAWAMPVRYRNCGLEVDCLIPRWADVAFHIEQDPRVLLLVPNRDAPATRWLQIAGAAQLLDLRRQVPVGFQISDFGVDNSQSPTLAPHASAGVSNPQSPMTNYQLPDLYVVVRITPQRIDLIDESQGWGARETLDL